MSAEIQLFRLTTATLAVDAEALALYPEVVDWLPDVDNDNANNRLADADLRLTVEVDSQYYPALSLQWRKPGEKKPIMFKLDFATDVMGLKTFPAAKQGAFNQAIGKKTEHVLDATGGWGGDALLMAMQGYRVRIFERNPLMAILLNDGFSRLSRFLRDDSSSRASTLQTWPLIVPQVQYANSITSFQCLDGLVDCAYLDPMFPPKRKKSAAANKQMQLLQWLLGEEADAVDLLDAVLACGVKRVAVKRPDYAAPLRSPPTQQFSSKLVHYDVYLQP